MNTLEYLNKLKLVKVNALTRVIVKKNTFQIVQLNQIALDKGRDYEKSLVGVYAEATASWAKSPHHLANQPKEAGAIYNFDWTGALINGIYITYKNNIIRYESRGEGAGDKLRFVDDNKLIGVSDDDAEIINFEIILPQLQIAIKKILRK